VHDSATSRGAHAAVDQRTPGCHQERDAVGERYLPGEAAGKLTFDDQRTLVYRDQDGAHNESRGEGAQQQRWIAERARQTDRQAREDEARLPPLATCAAGGNHGADYATPLVSPETCRLSDPTQAGELAFGGRLYLLSTFDDRTVRTECPYGKGCDVRQSAAAVWLIPWLAITGLVLLFAACDGESSSPGPDDGTMEATPTATPTSPASPPPAAATGAPAVTATPASGGNIRDVPWRDRAYEVEGRSITVKDGMYREETPSVLELRISEPVFGDLTGDGPEEAVLIKYMNFGGSGTFTEAEVYTLRDGQPLLLGRIPGGDRGMGGLDAGSIENGKVIVRRFQMAPGDGACCPSQVRIESWVFVDGAMVELESERRVERRPR
jgi:hypothetical protein